MTETIHLSRSYSTNGRVIPAGQLSTDDLRDLMRDEKNQPISLEEAKAAQADLLRREAKYATYMQGIHESTKVTYDAGTQAMGSGE